MAQAPQYILCPYCNVAVKEYHRHCPYCGHDLRRKITTKPRRFSLWKAAIIAAPLAAFLTIYLPLDSDYLEFILPLQFIATALGMTVVFYLGANLLIYVLHWIKYEK